MRTSSISFSSLDAYSQASSARDQPLHYLLTSAANSSPGSSLASEVADFLIGNGSSASGSRLVLPPLPPFNNLTPAENFKQALDFSSTSFARLRAAGQEALSHAAESASVVNVYA